MYVYVLKLFSGLGCHKKVVLTRMFPLAVFTGWPSFNHVMEGLGMPLAMHCNVVGLYITTDLSEDPVDLIVGGTTRNKTKINHCLNIFNVCSIQSHKYRKL